MKVSPAAAPAVSLPGPGCALKGVRLGAGGAGAPLLPSPPPRFSLSEHSVVSPLCRAGAAGSPTAPPLCPGQAAAAASLLMDMKGCYSRLAALVPTLPRHRRVSKVEILQAVIDYIADLQLELQHPIGAAPGGSPVAAAAAPSAPGAAVAQPAVGGAAAAANPEAPCVNPADRILCR